MRVRIFRPLALSLLLAFPLTAQAGDDKLTLYDEFGGEAALRSVIGTMLDLSLEDPRMAPIFANSDMKRLEKLLNIHICHIADGPCDYEGQDMRRAHDGLGIRTIHFNLLVENMQVAMDAEDIPFRTQNRLLARLAPFHDDVTGRSDIPPRKTKPASYSAAPLSDPESDDGP